MSVFHSVSVYLLFYRSIRMQYIYSNQLKGQFYSIYIATETISKCSKRCGLFVKRKKKICIDLESQDHMIRNLLIKNMYISIKILI